jgi:uncharacterized tellurite resistance protein B-like protein
MLSQIMTFFEQNLLPGSTDTEEEAEHRLRLAVAALLLEMTRMDDQVRPEECEIVESAIRGHFDLTANETQELIDLAAAERCEATDYFQFTSLINKHYTPQQRVQLIEHLWKIAYADQTIHHYEEHLVRKIAELLHVPHSAFIVAKHRSEGGSSTA